MGVRESCWKIARGESRQCDWPDESRSSFFKDSVCALALGMAVCGWSLGLKVEIGRYPSDMVSIIETALEPTRASVQCRITRDNGRVGCKNSMRELL